jgi:hypothetical protein
MSRAGIPRLLVIAMLAAGACSTAHVGADYDHGTRFSSFHRFTLVPRSHPGTGGPLVEQRTYDAITAELTSKGFTYVTDAGQADFMVDFTISASDPQDVRPYPAMHGGPWSRAGGWDNQADVHRYQEGTLAIDVLDAHGGKAVWHGSAKKKLSQSDIANSQFVIRDAVAAVLAAFPPRDP